MRLLHLAKVNYLRNVLIAREFESKEVKITGYEKQEKLMCYVRLCPPLSMSKISDWKLYEWLDR